MTKLKKLWKSKTAIFGALIASLGVVQANIQIIPTDKQGYVLTVIGIATVWLRMLTNLPLEQK